MFGLTRKANLNRERLARLKAEAKVDLQEEKIIEHLKLNSVYWNRINELRAEVDYYKRLFLLINQEDR